MILATFHDDPICADSGRIPARERFDVQLSLVRVWPRSEISMMCPSHKVAAICP